MQLATQKKTPQLVVYCGVIWYCRWIAKKLLLKYHFVPFVVYRHNKDT